MLLSDEVRHPKNYFDMIWEHKDIRSYRSMFEGGLMHFDREMSKFFKVSLAHLLRGLI